MGRKHHYEGEALTIHYDVRQCIHAGECVKGAPAVFNPANKPWVVADAADVDTVIDVVHRCPTGALTYERKDGGVEEAPPAENTIRVVADGPVILHGALVIEDSAGEQQEEIRAALCRCGLSKNKPYCDNSHVGAWTDGGDVARSKAKASSDEGATRLAAKVLPDGPVILDGPYRLLDGEGAACFESGGGALCRCGQSANRPFCDGAHKDAEFEDEGAFAG